MVSLSCCYVKLIVGHPTLPRCRAVIVSEQLCRGFWRNTSCLVHLAQERGVYSACVCVCVHIAPPLFFDFPVQAVSLLQSLSQMKEKHSLIYIGMRKLFISAPLPSFQSLSFLLLAFSVWINKICLCPGRDGDPEILNYGDLFYGLIIPLIRSLTIGFWLNSVN